MPVNSMWLDGVMDRLKRAEEHFDTLKSELRRWQDDSPYRIVQKTNADKTKHSVVVRVRRRPPTERWAVIASDCLHNLRTTLDNLVYAIAVEQSSENPPPDFDKLQFPIFDTPEKFDSGKWRIKTLSADVIAALESVQPYKRTHPSLPPLLSILRDFDDSDKHRLLHVMLTRPQQGKFGDVRGFPDEATVRVEFEAGEIVDKAEIASLTFSVPAPDVKYQFRADFVIAMTHAIGPPGSVPWSDVGAILIRMIPEVRTILDIVSVKA